MKFYETTYIVHSALQEGRLNDIIESVNSFVKSSDGEILYFDNWGRKKLSYMIEKQKYGTYVFFQFKISDISKIKNLNMEFEHNANILRSLIVNIEKEDILEELHIKNEITSDDKSLDKKPADEALVAEKPADEAPSIEKPIDEAPVAEKPADEAASIEKPIDEAPVDGDTYKEDSKIEDEKKEQ
tara:strand:+ start:22 stop:576 length:555 start_codon:yes stop_codon:yes gene_type:complete